METLRLQAADVINENNWRWLLTDTAGMFLADQRVALKPTSFEYQGFVDVLGYLTWNATPDRRRASEAELLVRLGDWLGSNLFGAVGRAIAEHAPAIVRVFLPKELEFLLHRPLALARVNGLPLASRTSLVFDTEDIRERPKGSIADRLRMLAVFSLPTETSAAPLRHERYELNDLIRRIGAQFGTAVELRVLQYGVTRERFESVLEEGAGWDVIHLSGHGIAARSGLILEQSDGSPDVLTADELAFLLRPARSQLKLIVISYNRSSAIGLAEQRQYLGFGDPDLQAEDAGLSSWQGELVRSEERPRRLAASVPLSELALKLATRLGCAILATRYPLAEETTVKFNERLYRGLFERRRNVASATSAALSAIDDADPATRLMALASPVLIGSRSADLTLAPPEQESGGLEDGAARLAFFPPEPRRFVGRAGPMALASAALAPESGYQGVFFHGLAGGGKTACALELVYRHADVFQPLLWWQAPAGDADPAAALASLGNSLEAQLSGFSFRAILGDTHTYQRQLIDLTTLLEEFAVLMVLDGLDTLLNSTGQWRDPRWKELIDTLATQRGQSRAILTSRVPLEIDDSSGILILPIYTLSLDDTILLAEDLPNLHALLRASTEPYRASVDEAGTGIDPNRELVRRVLYAVQGHPKLLEMADAAAADPARLSIQLAAAETAASGQALDTFFREGTTALDAAQFLDTLDAWTTTTLDAIPEPARLMAQFLACLEEDDRQSWIIDANWADLWRRLAQPGDPPAPAPLLATLTAAALIQADRLSEEDQGSPPPTTYRMHSSIAQAIRAIAPDIQAATDTELAATWVQISDQARQQESGVAGQVIIRAGLAAAPYLLRLQEWDTAGALLERALVRDRSPATIQAALPALRAIANATQSPEALNSLARSLASIDPAEAETLLRASLTRAAADENFELAAAIARTLSNLLADTGRLHEALDLASQTARYSQQAGLGPWTQLANQAQQLQLLGRMGQHQQILAQVQALRGQMDTLPATSASNETVAPWNVREGILDIGRYSAQALGEWQQSLDLNAAKLASMRARGASTYEIIRSRYNDAEPLIELGRLADAERILLETQQVYEDQNDIARLKQVLTTRAFLEDTRGRPQQALEFERTAIRLAYIQPEPHDIAISHHQLANYLQLTGADPAAARAHRLAAALLFQLTGMTHELADTSRALAMELRRDADRGDLPGAVDEVIRVAEQTEGVYLDRLITNLQSDRHSVAGALAEILHIATDTDSGQDPAIRDQLRQWEPVIAATVAAAGGDSDAATQLTPFLDQMAQSSDWAALAAVLRRIIAGEQADSLLDGLDPIDTAIAVRTLEILTARPQSIPSVDAQWQPIIADVVAAASGEQKVSAELDGLLDQLADTSDWATLVAVLREILAGERDPDQLGLDAMDAIDSAIVKQVLTGLAGEHSEQLRAWKSRGMDEE